MMRRFVSYLHRLQHLRLVQLVIIAILPLLYLLLHSASSGIGYCRGLNFTRSTQATSCSLEVDLKDTGRLRNRMPCSEADIVKNAEFLSKSSTTCPSEPWYWEWQSKLLASPAATYIEVGCNKASDAVLNLRAFTGNTGVDIDEWQQATKLGGHACAFDRERWNSVVKNPSGTLYTHFCIEAAAENAKPVQEAARQLGYDKLGLRVYHNAVSSSTTPSTIRFPVIPPGAESVGIDTDHSQYAEFYEVNVTTVDTFVEANDVKSLDVLKIDTEGNDPLVIIGATNTLMRLKPSYLQFENHGIGRWKTWHLKDVIDLLDNLSYECFWATNSGKLIRLSMCYSSEYDKMKTWSNVACYNRGKTAIRSIMEGYVWS